MPPLSDESERLRSLRALDILDTPPEHEFDALVQAAALACGTSASAISLIDSQRLWIKASVGLGGLKQVPREGSFCHHAIQQRGLFQIPDARDDARFADLPDLPTLGQIRFYAGLPLRLSDGAQVGTLCVMDATPRELTAHQHQILRHLTDATVHALESRRFGRQQQHALRASASLLSRTGALAEIGGWELDLDTEVMSWSEQTRLIHGLKTDIQPNLDMAISFHAPIARPVIRAAITHAIADGSGWDLELPFIQADGTEIWVRSVGQVEQADGRPIRVLGALQNITQTVEQRQALERANELLHVTLQSIGDAVITTNEAGEVTWLNPVAERMTGWRTVQAIGRPLARVFYIVNEDNRQPVQNPVTTCLMKGTSVGMGQHTLLLSRDGREFGIEDSAAPIRNARGDVLGVVLIFRDVTEQRRLSGEMRYRATHDTLTALINRTEFETRLLRTLTRAQAGGSEHALLFIDLDQFKLVNDTCGHAVGDQLLQQVAQQLREATRARDTLARIGGDEFAVILEHCPGEQALRVAQQICERMDDFRFEHEGRRFHISASVGLVAFDARWTDLKSLVQAADTSCFAAKEGGRNRVHVWLDTDLAIRARQGETQWANRLEQALDEERFVLHAQRIERVIDNDGALYAEVLIRLPDSEGNLIQPGAFLPAAERFHLASRIDRWVLRKTVEHLQALNDDSRVSTLCVNLSGQSVGDRAFHRETLAMLTIAGEAVCRRLCLEITETAAVTAIADAAAFIENVRNLGVRIALDDFGAGASSFGYLKSLTVDIIKIDGQFIRDLIEDPLDDAAVRCFVDVARVIGVETVAEFVDRPAILTRIGEIGIDFAQGYLKHRPEALEDLLATQCSMPIAPGYSPCKTPARRRVGGSSGLESTVRRWLN